MTPMTVADRIDQIDEDELDAPILLEGVSWETYESLIRDFEESGQHKRVTYDQGRMAIVSPLPRHEKWKSLLGCFVEAIADARGVPISTYGQTTWRRKARRRGLEADECFYIQHELQMRGKLDIDLEKDPPPDLCIEIDLRRTPIDKLAVYAGLEFPEVWHMTHGRIEVALLQSDGSYQDSPTSAAMPFLRPAGLKQFLDRFGETDQNSLLRTVREWAKSLPA